MFANEKKISYLVIICAILARGQVNLHMEPVESKVESNKLFSDYTDFWQKMGNKLESWKLKLIEGLKR